MRSRHLRGRRVHYGMCRRLTVSNRLHCHRQIILPPDIAALDQQPSLVAVSALPGLNVVDYVATPAQWAELGSQSRRGWRPSGPHVPIIRQRMTVGTEIKDVMRRIYEQIALLLPHLPRYTSGVPTIRIREAAQLLGVSDDTIRRWIDQGSLSVTYDQSGRKVIAGDVLAEFWRTNARPLPPNPLGIGSSAPNRMVGLVTKVISDKVMSEVVMQCGPLTITSLMSTEAARELKLEPGSVAVAVIKATTVVVETPGEIS